MGASRASRASGVMARVVSTAAAGGCSGAAGAGGAPASVAAGAAEIQPVCQGSELTGIVTARAAERLAGNSRGGGVVRGILQVPVMECRSCHSQRRPRSRRRRSGWCMAPGGGTPPEGPAQCSDPTAGAAACRAERRPPAVGGGWQAQQRHASENDAQQVALTLQTVCQLLLVPSFASHVGHTADSHSAKSAPRPATCTGPLEACWQPIRRPSQTARTAAAAGTSARVGMWVVGRAASGRVGEGALKHCPISATPPAHLQPELLVHALQRVAAQLFVHICISSGTPAEGQLGQEASGADLTARSARCTAAHHHSSQITASNAHMK